MQFEGYIPGAYLVDCDRCGMTYYSFQTCIEDYTGLRVCRGCLDKTPTYPTPPPDKISVPNPRPEQESIAYGNTNTTQQFGANLFPDPFIDPSNDGLWSAGTTSQMHVESEFFSKKLNNQSTEITVSGLTTGSTYRFKVSVWTPDTINILVDGVQSGLFVESLELEKWNTDTSYFIATATTAVLSFESLLHQAWFDSIYIQEFLEIETYLTPSEQVDNVKPKTITEDLSAQPDIYDFFAFDDDTDFNSTGLDDGTLVDIED